MKDFIKNPRYPRNLRQNRGIEENSAVVLESLLECSFFLLFRGMEGIIICGFIKKIPCGKL